MSNVNPRAAALPHSGVENACSPLPDIEQFLAVVAHELRSPLNGIQSWTHVLEAQLGDATPAMQRALTGIKTGVDQQVRLLDGLMDAAAVLGGSLQLTARPFVLRVVLDEAIEVVSAEAANKEISLNSDLRLEDQCVSGEPQRIRQLFVNLLENAIRYTPAGGVVNLSARVRSAVQEQARGTAMIVVRDTGRGITEARLAHLFEPFYQGTELEGRRGAGVGLGLAVVRQLVLLHGGCVAVSSAGENRGCEFSVCLPLSHV